MKVTVQPYEKGLFEALCKEYTGGNLSEMGNARFYTHCGKEQLTHISEYSLCNEIRTVTCPLPEYGIKPESTSLSEKKNDASLYQICVDNRRINCGMSYVLHLPDGRFFIIDGGYFSKGEDNRLYSFLRTLQPEGKLAIAGWFFSHAHQDHIGAFIDFVWQYRGEYEIDALYYTFPSLSLPEAEHFSSFDNSTIREFFYCIDRAIPEVKRCYLHTGDRFSLASIDFEVLFTHEDIYPEKIGTFNNTSTILRFTCEGQSVLFLGDLQTASCRKLELMMGEALKSDVVQIAHHGFNGSTVETYDLVSPEIALWPTCADGYHGNCERTVNAHIIAMPCVKEHIIAGIHGSRKLSLPYTAGSSTEVDIPLLPL